nr:CBS domain-containing protein [uncultured Pseudonocardia sp.]
MLADVFTATDRLVAEVMVPRTEIDFLNGAMTTEEAAAFVGHPHSRYPVAGRSPDDVVGVVPARDVLGAACRRRLGDTAPVTVAALAGTALAIPDTLPLIEALSRMRRHGRLAVVVDPQGPRRGDDRRDRDGRGYDPSRRGRRRGARRVAAPRGRPGSDRDHAARRPLRHPGRIRRDQDGPHAADRGQRRRARAPRRFTVLETDGHRAALVRIAPDAT